MADAPRPLAILLDSAPVEYRRRSYRHAGSWMFYGVFFAVVWNLGPFVIRELGGSALQSLLVNIGQGLPLVFAVLWVPFIERRNPVRLTGLVLSLGGGLLLFSGLGSGLWSFVLIVTAGMVLSTLARPSLGTALEQVYPARWRGKLMSLPYTANMLVRVLCVTAVGWLLERNLQHYRWVFPAAGGALVISGALFRSIGGSRGDRSAARALASVPIIQQVLASVRATLRNKALLGFLAGYFISSCGGVAYFNALPLFASDELALTPEQWGLARAGFMVATLSSFFLWGVFMDRFGAPLQVIVSWTVQAAIFLGMFFVRSWVSLLVLVSARGLFQSGNMLAFFPLVMYFTKPSETSRGMSLHFTLWGIRWVLAPVLVIGVIDGGLFPMRYLFLVSMALAAAGAVVMGLVWWRNRGRHAE